MAMKRVTTTSNTMEIIEAFKSLSLEDPIFPLSSNLVGNIGLDLTPNNIQGKYANVDEYIDIQFRLLKESFFKPIREDLATYKQSLNTKLNSIVVHSVKFLRKGVKHSKHCYVFELLTNDDTCMQSKNKRFMMGSLLIFSKDNLASIFYGRVEDCSNLVNKIILVSFFEKIEIQDITYTMLECKHFFEPYFNTLRVLKSLKGTTIPMSNYIIRGCTSKILPEYLGIMPLRIHTYKLNKSQDEALREALNREFVIIQGPPGTGKTFLALEITKRLIWNYRIWWEESPLIVISYSNHALDQFLEGLLSFTTEIMRLGGQTKSYRLKEYSISEWRHEMRYTDEHQDEIEKLSKPKSKYISLQGNIEELGKTLEELKTVRPSMIFHLNEWSRSDCMLWMLEDDGSMRPNSSYLVSKV